MECMRQYVGEVLDFIADMHTLTKLKVGSGIYWYKVYEFFDKKYVFCKEPACET